MSPVVRTALLSVAALVMLAFFALGVGRIVDRQRTADRINEFREELYRARVSADRCRGSLQTSEASLLSLRSTIDSLRVRVDSFETLDTRGVPAERYEEYLGTFDQYNDSVEVWEGRERRLRTADSACRATIERHNALTDSLQRILSDAGIDADR